MRASHAADADARRIGYWLMACCAVLLALVMLGGATRLTGSGLSIVEWRPVTGILPPLSEAAWAAELDKYRRSPEYQRVHRGMSIDQFKSIFWLEYWHRVLARALGLLFALPLAWFWLRGRLPARLRLPLLGILALFAAQGWMGWFMVSSGLVDIPRVSPYRLAAHLGLALLIYAAMFRLLLGLVWRPRSGTPVLPRGAWRVLLGLVAATVLMGAFVAGLKAGYVYNTFPRMDGQWVPAGLMYLEPAWRNLGENPLAAQFLHRCLALLSAMLALGLWGFGLYRRPGRDERLALHVMLAAVLLQLGLGIATLLLYVPVWLGTLHQGGAVLVLSAVLALGHALGPAPVARGVRADGFRAPLISAFRDARAGARSAPASPAARAAAAAHRPRARPDR